MQFHVSAVTISVDGYIAGPTTARLDLEHLGVRQSPFATFIDYRVKR